MYSQENYYFPPISGNDWETQSAICIFVDLYNIKSLDDFSRKYSEIIANILFNWNVDVKKLTKKLADNFINLSPGVYFDEFGNPGFKLNINKIEQQEDIKTILEIPKATSFSPMLLA